MYLDPLFPFAIFCDVTALADTPEEQKTLAITTVNNALRERLAKVSEGAIREALLFANVKLMQAAHIKYGILVSVLVIAKGQAEILLAGSGTFKAYSIDDDFTELLFQDPLNTDGSIKNALGKVSEPQFHVRRVMRSHLPGITVTSLNGKHSETVVLEERRKVHPVARKSFSFLTFTLAFICVCLAFFLYLSFPHKIHREHAVHMGPKVVLLEEPRMHIVSSGESLSSISQKYYGTPKRWEDIHAANKELISANKQIKPGMQLVIP